MSYKVGVLTVSDTASKGAETDQSGSLLVTHLTENGEYDVQQRAIIPDDPSVIRKTVEYWCDITKLDLILITGGTGFAPNDTTPEAVAPLLSRETPGLTHLLLATSTAVTPFAALSRPVTGIRNQTLIITFPGSPKACKENLSAIINIIPHGLDLLRGKSSRKLHEKKQHHQHHHQHHVCKHRSDTSEMGHNGLSAPLDRPVGLRARSSPYPIIPVNEAEKIVSQHAVPLEICETPVSEALVGHVLAEDVKAKEPVPGYRASIVDGYAVRAADGPGKYKVGSVSLASGSSSDVELPEGNIARIATGGVVPPGMDAVVMVEDTRLVRLSEDGKEELEVEIMATAQPGDNIRTVGSDCEVGTLVGYKGQPISNVGGELGVLASVGIQKVKVYRKPRVGVLSTGNEVVDHLSTDQLKFGEIRDTNRITLLAAIKTAGYEAIDLGIVKDTVNELESRLKSALDKVDVLITTGGVSMGEADFMKPVLEQKLGATIQFGRVLMKPGKPTTFATVPFNEHKKLVFALPGNPASATVTFYLFVLPALRKIAGYAQFQNPIVSVELSDDVSLDPRPEYHRAVISITENGLKAESTGGQRSSRMLSLRQANGLLKLPAKTDKQTQLRKGDKVPCVLIGQLNPLPF